MRTAAAEPGCGRGRSRSRVLAGLLIVLLVGAVYAGSLSGPFIFDDTDSITDNPTLRHLWPPGPLLSPPYAKGQTVGGRPVLNLTLAVDYAWGGLNPGVYHATNALIHALAVLALFGLVRRTLLLPGLRSSLGSDPEHGALRLAGCIALLWGLHPLLTESVTYVVQRAESLMGLLYLTTLYAFVRAAERSRAGLWSGLCAAACLAGMATKEVMVSAPVVVLLYDRTFLAGSFGGALRARGRLHGALACTWVLLAWLVLGTHMRGGSEGGVSWAGYALTQPGAILHYLRLALWPSPLIFDYGTLGAGSLQEAAGGLLLVSALLAGSLLALVRRPVAGFLAGTFWLVLAPTSLVAGARQTLAEHRMYLALVPVVVGIAGAPGLWVLRRGRPAWLRAGSAAAALGVLAALAAATWARNAVYSDPFVLWTQTARDCPDNPYPHYEVGEALVRLGQVGRARAEFEAAVRLKPDYAEALDNLGNVLLETGEVDQACARFKESLRLDPTQPEGWSNLGVALTRQGRLTQAEEALRRALERDPQFARARFNLASVLYAEGRLEEAVASDQAALDEDPGFVGAYVNQGITLARLGRIDQAVARLAEALRLQPANADIHFNLGNILVLGRRYVQAASEYRKALGLDPGHAGARTNLGRLQDMGVLP